MSIVTRVVMSSVGPVTQQWRHDSAGGGQMPSIESFTDTTTGVYGNSLTLNAPTGITAGDLLLIIFRDPAINTNSEVINTPSGWTKIDEHGTADNDIHIGMFWKEATGSEGDVTVTSTVSSTGRAGWYLRISGADTTTPIHATSKNGTTWQAATPWTASGVTTSVDNCLLIAGFAADGCNNDPFTISGEGWVEEDESVTGADSNGTAGVFASKELSSAGFSGNCVCTPTSAGKASWILIAVAP